MYGVIIAFKKYRILQGILGSPWVGLDNFERLFRSPQFLNVFRNTLLISFYKIIFGFPAPIILALLLNRCARAASRRWCRPSPTCRTSSVGW